MLTLSTDHHSVYNGLPPVDTASKRLKSRTDYQSILQRLGLMISSAGLSNVLCVRLLHNHHLISRGEAMVERLEYRAGVPCLATVKVDSREVSEPCVPSVWKCAGNGEIEPLEYGYATLYSIPDGFFQTHKKFFARFAEAVDELGMGAILGLSLRSNVLNVDPVTEILAEFTGDKKNILVKRTLQEVNTFKEVYDTSWSCDGLNITACSQCYPIDPPDAGGHTHAKEEHMDEKRKPDEERAPKG
jgi:hypothetical protein